MSKLESLKITDYPAAFVELARKHNLLVDVLATMAGGTCIKVTSSENNLVVDVDLTALATAIGASPLYSAVYDVATFAAADLLPITSADVSDFTAAAAAAAPVQSVAGRTGNVVITAGDLSDFNANVDLRIANIASVDVINSDSKIAKVLRHPANYVTPANYATILKTVNAAGNITLDSSGFEALSVTGGGYSANIAFGSIGRNLRVSNLAACANGSPANIDTIVSNTY